MRTIVAAADHRIGFIRTILDEPGADDAYQRSIALYRAMLADTPADPLLRSAMALAYSDLIILLRKSGRASAVLDCFPPLLELRQRAGRRLPRRCRQPRQPDAAPGRVRRVARGRRPRPARRSEHAGELAEIYRLAIGREPRNPAPRNNLAWLLASRPEAVAARPGAGRRAGRAGRRGGPDRRHLLEHAGRRALPRRRLGRRGQRAGGVDAAPIRRRRLRLAVPGDGPPAARRAVAARRWLDRSLAWIEAHAPGDRGADPLPRRGLHSIVPDDRSADDGSTQVIAPPAASRRFDDAGLLPAPAPGSRSGHGGRRRAAAPCAPGSAPRRALTPIPGPIATESPIMKRRNSHRFATAAIRLAAGLALVVSCRRRSPRPTRSFTT